MANITRSYEPSRFIIKAKDANGDTHTVQRVMPGQKGHAREWFEANYNAEIIFITQTR